MDLNSHPDFARLDRRTKELIKSMQDRGILHGNDDGTISIKGTREDFQDYGLDPEALPGLFTAWTSLVESETDGRLFYEANTESK